MIYDVPTLRDNLWFLTANKLRYCGPKNRVDVIVFVIYNFEEVLRCLINTYTVNFSSCLGEFYSSLRSEKQTYLKLTVTITWFEIGNRGLYSYIHWSLGAPPSEPFWVEAYRSWLELFALSALSALWAHRDPRDLHDLRDLRDLRAPQSPLGQVDAAMRWSFKCLRPVRTSFNFGEDSSISHENLPRFVEICPKVESRRFQTSVHS